MSSPEAGSACPADPWTISTFAMAKTTQVQKRIKSLLRSLRRKYGNKRLTASKSILDEIMMVLLAPQIGQTAGRRALRNLRATFVDWNDVRVSRPFEIRDALGPNLNGGVSGDLSRRIATCLQEIFQKNGNLNLGHLREAKITEVRDFFGSLDSLAKHEVQLILLTALRRPVMPVDHGVLRVMRRIGLVSTKATAAASQRTLEESLGEQELYPCYRLLSEHAQRFCAIDEPKCKTCPVRLQCNSRDEFAGGS